MEDEPNSGPLMERICWRLVDILSRMLEPDERDAVRGDLEESGKTGGQALRDVIGLVARRQVAGRDDWAPWLAFRQRLLRSMVGILIATGLCFYFADNIYGYLARPLTDTLHALDLSGKLAYLNPVDPLNLYIELSSMTGLFLASPYVLWQFWLFVSPGPYRHEKRYVWPFITLTSTLFLGGGFFAYKLVLPAALRFLMSYGSRFQPMVTINEYWDLAITIMVGVGLVFELPSLCWLAYLRRKWGAKAKRAASPNG